MAYSQAIHEIADMASKIYIEPDKSWKDGLINMDLKTKIWNLRECIVEIIREQEQEKRNVKLIEINKIINDKLNTEDEKSHIWATGAFYVLCELGLVNENGEIIESQNEVF